MHGFESIKKEGRVTKVKKAKWIAIILVCVVGCVYCNMQMKNREDSFKEDIIVTEGTIESMESVLAETSGRYSNNRNVVGMVNIDGELYEVTLTVNGKPEHSVGEVVTCYGYNIMANTTFLRMRLSDNTLITEDILSACRYLSGYRLFCLLSG